MAKTGGEVRIKIGGDSSELEKEANRAARALAGVGSDAQKMGKKVDKSSDKLDQNARQMRDLSAGASNTKDEFGELSSGAAALASALDVVDPRLGAAVRGLGDMAGAAEGAIRLTKLQSGILATVLNPAFLLVTAAVAAAAITWGVLTLSLTKANEKLEQSDERLKASLSRLLTLKTASLELAVANGTLNKVDAARQKALMAINAQYEETLSNQMESVRAARSEFDSAILGKEAKYGLLKAERQRLANLQKEIAAQKRVALGLIEIKDAEEETKATTVASVASTNTAAAAERERLATIESQTSALISAQEAAQGLVGGLQAELDGLDKLNAKHQTTIDARGEMLKAELDALAELADAGEDTHARELVAIEQFESDKMAIAQDFAIQRKELMDTEADGAIKKQEEVNAAVAAGIQEGADALVSMAQTRIQSLENLGDSATAEQKRQALILFEVTKAAAVAGAFIHAGAASVRAFADYPFPASAIISGAAMTAALAQTAAIMNQEPPSFLVGGVVPGAGEVPIRAHGGEGVLTAKTTADLGGKSAIDALNRGDIGGQLNQLIGVTQGLGQAIMARPIVVEMRYNHEMFDSFIMDNLNRSKSPLRGYIKKSARRGGRTSGRAS